MKYSSYKKSIDSKKSINSERKIIDNNLSFRRIDLSNEISMKIDKLNKELSRLNEKRLETSNRNFKYFSQKENALKIIDFDIRLIEDKLLILKEKLKNPTIRISSINSKKFKSIGNGIYVTRR